MNSFYFLVNQIRKIVRILERVGAKGKMKRKFLTASGGRYKSGEKEDETNTQPDETYELKRAGFQSFSYPQFLSFFLSCVTTNKMGQKKRGADFGKNKNKVKMDGQRSSFSSRRNVVEKKNTMRETFLKYRKEKRKWERKKKL